MSKDYPCIYWNDGKCKKFSDDKVTSWCVWSPCASQTPSNADRIRSMSDEELAVFLDGFSSRCIDCAEDAKNQSCPIYKEGYYCRPQEIMEWLNQPAEEADNETD